MRDDYDYRLNCLRDEVETLATLLEDEDVRARRSAFVIGWLWGAAFILTAAMAFLGLHSS